MSTNNSLNSLLLRDNSSNYDGVPKLTSKNLIRLSENPISYNEIKCDAAENVVPNEITIFLDDINDSSSGLPIYNFSDREIEIHKLSRYVFPRIDLGPTESGQVQIPALQSLEYAVNLACHKLDDEVKAHWDDLCCRDVSFPELSENGIMATKYDLKHQITLYKKQKDKDKYVDSLAKGQNLDILATDLERGNSCDKFQGQNDRYDFPSGSHMTNFSKNPTRSTQHSPLLFLRRLEN